MDIKIRTDFQSIEEEIFKLNKYGKIFHTIRDNYTNFKNKEDFFQIYSLDKTIKNIFDKLYNSGADCSFAIYHILENINHFDFYPTLTDLINELEEKISCISQLEIILSESEEAHNKLDRPLYSIKEMNRLHKKQIDYLSKIKDVILNLTDSELYKKENNIVITTQQFHINNQTEKFHEKWWVISLLISSFGGLISWYFFSYQFAIIITIILFFIVLIFNPKRRFLRIGIGMLTFGSMSLLPSLSDWISSILNLNIHVNSWIGALLISSSMFLFFLDYKANK